MPYYHCGNKVLSSDMLTKVMHVWEVLPQYDRVGLLDTV